MHAIIGLIFINQIQIDPLPRIGAAKNTGKSEIWLFFMSPIFTPNLPFAKGRESDGFSSSCTGKWACRIKKFASPSNHETGMSSHALCLPAGSDGLFYLHPENSNQRHPDNHQPVPGG
jgi:hypothetical protein